MKQSELSKKVALLKDGQIVQIADNWFRAIKFENGSTIDCCYQCDLDSICRGDVYDVCCEMETVADHHWMLKLAST